MNPAASRTWLFLAVLALVLGLQWTAITRQSLVGDAAYHLAAGHQALRYGENLLNLEHPPLVKLVAALPLLVEEPLLPPGVSVDQALEASRRIFDDPELLHRVRLRSRLLVLLVFGLPFVAAAFFLGRTLHDEATGAVLALALGLSLPVIPLLAILQTDAAVALAFTLTVTLAVLYQRAPSAKLALLLGLAAGLALATKFSGVLAGPAVLVAFGLARSASPRRRLAHLALAAVTTLAVVHLTYAAANYRYDSAHGRDAIERYCRGEALIVDDQLRPWEKTLLAVERFDPLAAQWLTGFLGVRAQNEIGVYPSYAFGDLSSKGRPWYYPAVLLTRLPLVVLLLLPLAVFQAARRSRAGAILLTAGGVYLLAAVLSNYNLGVRHLLPVLPLLYLPVARWAAAKRPRAVVLLAVLAVEAVAVAPLWMSSTNTWWLGPANPTRLAFSVGDVEYRQNFLALEDALEHRAGPHQVVYPLVDEAEIRAYLPRAEVVRPGADLEPGWYAVSIMLEQYLPAIPQTAPEDVRGYANLVALARQWEPSWREISERGEDHGHVAGTFHLYFLRE